MEFCDRIKKENLKSFAHLGKKMNVRGGSPNEAILRADRRLFAQMIVIAETRKLSMSSVISHPLGPLPWSLARELQKDVPAAETISQPSAFIIDGMAMVQRLKGDHMSFAEIADVLMTMIMREGATSRRIDVVFDVYREISIENTERERREEVTQETSTDIFSHIKYSSGGGL